MNFSVSTQSFFSVAHNFATLNTQRKFMDPLRTNIFLPDLSLLHILSFPILKKMAYFFFKVGTATGQSHVVPFSIPSIYINFQNVMLFQL